MRRSTMLAPWAAAVLLVCATGALAQTEAERCLAMRLALVGASLENSLACHAWSVATRSTPSEECLAHGEQRLAEQLRAEACGSEAEITSLVESARDATELLVGSQVADRLAEFENALWRTEAIIDWARFYSPGLPWPDLSCRSRGFCPDLMILVCDTTARSDGSIDTSCDSLPESNTVVHDAPVITTENVALPTGEILSRGSSGSFYEVVIRMDESGRSFVGQGSVSVMPIFLTGQRVG
jgi:hypothetical protein